MEAIKHVTSERDVLACYPLLAQLRPHIQELDFLTRIQAQMEDGYRLAALTQEGHIGAVAGFRLGNNLAWGRHLYVDDLVTDKVRRSSGLGRTLFDGLIGFAREQGCSQLHLDSGVQRFDAHRFYLHQGMMIASHHFMLDLKT